MGVMAFSDIALLANDGDFLSRVTACVATEPNPPDNPPQWASANSWQMAATPGFGDKYSSAIANELPRPGNDQSVISDSDILAAVQERTTELQS